MLVLSKIIQAREADNFRIDSWLEEHWVIPQYRQAENEDEKRWDILACDWVGKTAQALDVRFFYTVVQIKEDLNLLPSLELIVKRHLEREGEVFEHPIIVHRDNWFWPYVPPFSKQAKEGTYCYVKDKTLTMARSFRAPDQALWFSNEASASDYGTNTGKYTNEFFNLFKNFQPH